MPNKLTWEDNTIATRDAKVYMAEHLSTLDSDTWLVVDRRLLERIIAIEDRLAKLENYKDREMG